jgi:hypothetical protein
MAKTRVPDSLYLHLSEEMDRIIKEGDIMRNDHSTTVEVLEDPLSGLYAAILRCRYVGERGKKSLERSIGREIVPHVDSVKRNYRIVGLGIKDDKFESGFDYEDSIEDQLLPDEELSGNLIIIGPPKLYLIDVFLDGEATKV